MSNHPIIVQKYGGVCLETPARIRAVASSLADLHNQGHRVVAIVSAMGRTTDELIEMAHQVSPAHLAMGDNDRATDARFRPD